LIPESSFELFWNHSPVEGSPSDDVLRTKDAFGKAEIYFTHFIRHQNNPPVELLWAAIARGQAIQCDYYQKAVDIIIPIALKPSTKFKEADLSAILIQVKNKVNREADNRLFPRAKELGWFLGTGHPYISMVFELGIQENAQGARASGEDVDNEEGDKLDEIYFEGMWI
jgi:hypothetical protein